jgi:DNA-binding MarR family transcriptional regulator
MINKPHEVTARVVIEFNRNMLRDLATYYGGGCTLNELRVMNQVILCSHEGRRCGVTALHNVTGIPIPTVSRAVTNLQKNGWLSSEQDPDEGRKRIISLGPRSLAGTWDAIEKRVQWINDLHEDGLPA